MRLFFNGSELGFGYWAVVLAAVISSPFATAQAPASTQPDIPAPIQAAVVQYQHCINRQFASMASVAQKRENLQRQCAEQRQALLVLYPVELRDWVASVVDGRINAVLNSLEQIEHVVADTAADVQTSVDELSRLETEAADSATEE